MFRISSKRLFCTTRPTFRKPKLLAISGSTRKGSINSMLLQAASAIATKAGADVTIVNMEDFPIPLYNQDTESEHIPETAQKLKQLFSESDGFIVASPEYNGSMTPLLCNTLTWMSRPFSKDETMYGPFQLKHGVVLSASPGALGGLRSLSPVRALLTNLGVNILPNQVAVGNAYKVMSRNDSGEVEITNERIATMLQGAMFELVHASRDRVNRDSTCAMVQELHAQYGNIIV
mmetsp:Transcript_19855/g.28542  ORF Transcript_19855/g.28542 Transcript_19855/m.28542 type:complete len:233 (+) Transcript_19855:43-741(+)